MPQVPPDDPPSISHNEPLENFDFESFENMDWTAVERNDIISRGFHTGSQDCRCRTDGLHIDLPHTSYDGCNSNSLMEVDRISSSVFDSLETGIGALGGDLHCPDDPFGVTFTNELTAEDLLIRDIVPIINSAECSINDMINSNGAQNGPETAALNWPQLPGIMQPTPFSAPPQPLMELFHAQRSNRNRDSYIGSKGWTTNGHQDAQQFQTSRAMSNQDYLFSPVQDPDLEFSWDSIDPCLILPDMETSTSDFIRVPQPQYSNDSSDWSAPSGEYARDSTATQDSWMETPLTRQHFPRSPYIDPQISNTAYENVASWSQLGLDLVRTHSPENTRAMYYETFSSAQHNVLSMDSYGPKQKVIQNHRYHSEPKVRSARPGSSAAHSSRQHAEGRTRGRVQKTRPGRMLTERGKEDAIATRRRGGQCENCRYTKKKCTVCRSMPCDECWGIIRPHIYLGPAICYERNYEQVFSVYSDFFGIGQRDKAIQSALQSMHGPERDLPLGSGLQEYENVISIDYDSSRVRDVKIRSTKITLRKQWISTHDLNSNNRPPAPEDMETDESYAIVNLPQIADLDNWGRQDIRDLAEKWPSCLEAKYALAFLKYVEVSPPLPCYKIVQATMRIISLGKNLDSRRPVDHNKIVKMVTSFQHSPFGIEGFNERKAHFQLSMPARLQLYIHAARGIEETQRILGNEIDNLFKSTVGGRTKDNILVVGACLRCLGLEYRNRLQRYREFASGGFDDRIERNSFMYTFFTRLYDLWYRGTALPMSPDWSAFEYSQSLGNDQNLVEAFSELSLLEQKFCDTRLDQSNDDDLIYKALIVKRALRKSGKPGDARKVNSF